MDDDASLPGYHECALWQAVFLHRFGLILIELRYNQPYRSLPNSQQQLKDNPGFNAEEEAALRQSALSMSQAFASQKYTSSGRVLQIDLN